MAFIHTCQLVKVYNNEVATFYKTIIRSMINFKMILEK